MSVDIERARRKDEAIRASFRFELLLAVKHHTRRLFITGFQNSRSAVSISVTIFVMIARPPVSNKDIDDVCCMIKTDKHVTYHEIQASLGIGISQIQSMLHKHLNMKKPCSQWILHNLTEAQKTDRALGAVPCLADALQNQDCANFGSGTASYYVDLID
ncbi:hypothetical protein EVAR_55461_1 [Eumeta japonica]|uniref:Histone-lysine N-methyltransferase SETMAR n=1 Tax=Eumeta variegata TaxID=151549 RepID=A0A4C1Y1N4_EUMVA|nr:hypothetical protein EVAR_55461_1 [Eumeta japonica]